MILAMGSHATGGAAFSNRIDWTFFGADTQLLVGWMFRCLGNSVIACA